MNCPNCSAPMTPVDGRSYLTCRYCHTFQFLTPSDESADRVTLLFQQSDLECPVCAEILTAGLLDKTNVVFCEQCRGVLVNSESFSHVVQFRRRNYAGSDDEATPIDPDEYRRQLNCPTCKKVMEVHPYYGPGAVVIDSCASCRQIWFDHGEIACIERAPGVR